VKKEEIAAKLAELESQRDHLSIELGCSNVPQLLKDVVEKQLDSYEREISELQKQLPVELDEETRAKQVKQIIKDKGLNIEYLGDGMLFKRKSIALTSLGGCAVEAESAGNKSLLETEKAAPTKRKRTLEDYRPTDDELNQANKLSNVDMRASDIYVFEPQAANTETDIDYEEFDENALNEMGAVCSGAPQQLDHSRSIMDTKGKVLSGRVANKKLYMKFYVPDLASNADYIANIAFGVWNNVSVSCGIPLDQYQCSSCKRAMVSQECPHRPGMMDEKGAMVRGIIKGIQRFFELSMVWLGAQNNSSIRRSEYPGGRKEASVETSYEDVLAEVSAGNKGSTASKIAQVLETPAGKKKTVDEIHTDLQAILTPLPNNSNSDPNPPSTFDRIPVDERFISESEKSTSQGDNPVTEKQKQADEATEAKTEETAAPAEVTEAPAANAPAEEAKPAEIPAEAEVAAPAAETPAGNETPAEATPAEATPALEAPKEAAAPSESAGNKEVLDQLKQLMEVLGTTNAKVEALAETVEELKSKKSAELSEEDIVRGFLQVAAEIDAQEEVNKAPAKPLSFADRIRQGLTQ
jgi:hypothetical protein